MASIEFPEDNAAADRPVPIGALGRELARIIQPVSLMVLVATFAVAVAIVALWVSPATVAIEGRIGHAPVLGTFAVTAVVVYAQTLPAMAMVSPEERTCAIGG